MRKPYSILIFSLTVFGFLLNTNCAKPANTDSEPILSGRVSPLPTPTPSMEPEKPLEQNNHIDYPKEYSKAVIQNIENLSLSPQYPMNPGLSSVSRRCLSKDCQNRFVSLIISGADVSAMCSGVPLAKNLVLTNFHCINKLAFDPSKNVFTAGVYALSPMYKNDIPRSVQVKKVVAHSPMNYFRPDLMGHPYSMDYAILELETDLDITPPKTNFTYGFNDGETYTVLEFAPYASGEFDEQRTLREYKCKAIHNSIFGPAAKSETFPISFFSDCPIGPGNSGSPIYNSHGELVGIIAGQINPLYFEYLSQFSIGFGLLPSRFKNVGWGNLLLCLPIVKNGVVTSSVGSNCDSELSNVASKNNVSISQKKMKAMEYFLSKNPPQNSFFHMSPKQLKETRQGFLYGWVIGSTVVQVPDCIYQDKWNRGRQLEGLILKAVTPKLNIYGQYEDVLFGFDFPTYIKFEDLENLESGKKAKIKVFSGISGDLISNPASNSQLKKYDPKQLIYSSEISFCE